ncbi:MAG: MMPL family transporter [Phycisphaera sp.]|nr:MMPL family transporter [Phycisphaera sp.]
MFDRIRNRCLRVWPHLLAKRPGWVLFLTGALVAASIAITVGKWHFQSDRNALLSDKLDWNKRFIHWTHSFAGTYDLTVVIDAGEHPDTKAARELADELGVALQSHTDTVSRVIWRFHVSRASPHAMRLLKMEDFKARLSELESSAPVLRSPTPAALVGETVRQMLASQNQDVTPAQAGAGIDQLNALLRAIGQTISDPSPEGHHFEELSLDTSSAGVQPWEYLTSDNNRLYFMRVTPQRDGNTLSALSDSIKTIRSVIHNSAAKYPTVQAGLTGIEVIENDETQAVQSDSTLASVVALGLIAVLLIAAFHSVRTPLLAIGSLLFGVAWSFGYLFLFIGHLQVLSVFFTVMLLGLGIAYGVHLASNFELIRHRHPDDEEGFAAAMSETFSTVGPGIVTGAVTTAAAFFTTVFTEFTGVAEMGHIASVGILLCLVAMFTVFPAMLRLFKPGHAHFKPMENRRFHFFEEQWITPFIKRPVITVSVAIVVMFASLGAISRMHFDYNLESLLPTGIDSVAWQERISEGGQSIYTAVSIVPDMKTAKERTEAFRKLPTVGSVQGIGLLFPEDDLQKVEMIEAIRQKLSADLAKLDQPIHEPPGQLVQQLTLMQSLIVSFAAQTPEELRPSVKKVGQTIRDILTTLSGFDDATRSQRLENLQRQYDHWRRWIAQAFDTTPLSPDDLPGELLEPYRNTKGQFVVEAVPKLPDDGSIKSPLSPYFLPRFIRQLETIDPEVTGVIVQYYRSGYLIKSSYQKAGLWALLVVFILVYLDFRRLDDALLALAPVAVGFAATFGVMYLCGMKINPANIIVLPLMFGIGVDAGVHVIHRYRQDPTTRPLGLTAGTGKGITVTSYTSMIGFGAMMLARHRGIFSLGFVLTVGIGLTLLACYTIMPAWLELRARRQQRRASR